MSNTKYLTEVSIGQTMTLVGFEDEKIASKLLAMGSLPGIAVKVVRKAPFGGAIYVKMQDTLMALRQAEAASIIVK